MSYTFNPDSGDTFADLQARVVFNSFSETRYAEFVKRALNDAVTEICRKVGLDESYEVLAYSDQGVVDDPFLPWTRINEVWAATGTSASGLPAFLAATRYRLQLLPDGALTGWAATAAPLFYVVNRKIAQDAFGGGLDLKVVPPGTGGVVAVRGIQRPRVMVNDGDRSGIGTDLDAALVAYAKAEAFDNEDDDAAAAKWRAKFDAAVRAATYGGVQDDAPDVVPGTWDC